MRFIPNIHTMTVTDTETGNVTQCKDVMHMAQVRRDLELAARAPAKAGTKMARRDERKQGGQRV